MHRGDGSDDEVEATEISASPPRRQTRLYGAIDPPEHYPATQADSAVLEAVGLAAGDTLTRYQIADVLGRGGMGEVLSARDEQIGRWVAIKRLRIENPSSEVLSRFLREARIQGRLEHPAVVPVHELWTDDANRPFFVMKQLTGTTLADVIPRLILKDREALEQFSRQQLLRAFADVCLAIEFAHTRGVVHRDLKPANIVLGDFGEVYVLDWGIARVAGDTDTRASFADIDTADGSETVAGAILGTPGYISPEQIRGDPDLDGRADVYALDCILFEILTLEPLHPRGPSAIASAIAGADARASIRAPDRDIPPELDAICVRATAPDRDQRFSTARQLATEVQRFLDGNRDVALRVELARSELDNARSILAEGTSSTHRRDALRAAARALALDPTNPEPADLVGRLMLEPPKETPPEVEAELERHDLRALRNSASFGLLAACAYLIFFPILYWAGYRELWYTIAGPALSVAIIFVEIFVARRNPYWSGYLGITGNLLMFAMFSWIISPVVIGPGPGIIMITLLAAHRKLIKPWLLATLTSLATLSPWIVEAFGLVGSRTSVEGGDLIVHTTGTDLDPTVSIVGLLVYLVGLAFLAALLGRLQDDERRGVRRTLQLQTWQLRQLVPRPNTLPPR
ncbi:MAG TPA: serine/threonine-protein kinase [Kofleriaceae bacterium]|nr:serine/threonine-protein kinase [Kofleriaceae bacterium]